MIRLEVYVDDECLTCSRSFAIASEIHATFPDVVVVVIEPGSDDGLHRHLVAAVPTYILNGRVVSLGNPTFGDLSAAILELTSGVP